MVCISTEWHLYMKLNKDFASGDARLPVVHVSPAERLGDCVALPFICCPGQRAASDHPAPGNKNTRLPQRNAP
jgi:hypothetical protein